MAGIYIHIPFCKQACHYCDFHFSTSLGSQPQMTAAVAKEIEMQKDYLAGEEIGTIYFGGGTPSLLKEEELKKILGVIRTNFKVSPDAEITLEANPDDLNKNKLEELRGAGVNRLSIGIQSFRDDILKFFNRAHDSNEAVRSIEDARTAGFNNISIDLIYGVPGQDNNSWLKGLDDALKFRPEHISAYSLTIEERTVFGKWRVANKLTPMDEGLVAEQFEILMDTLTKNGYDHYEISNFSLPGYYSRHNSSYWNGTKYLGVGPSAHSYDRASRQFNVSNNAIYVRRIEEGELPNERELLSRGDKINEYLMVKLRGKDGVDLEYLSKEFNFQFSERQRQYIDELARLGKLVIENNHLALTNAGKLLADKIAADLFVISE
ncbi:MAG TPA: radical SAM family heme chaperone HemW [Cyclobacteriaceae bacterium]|nr:radical SAM family heme chaperone HemW [Cyclobacteriaceae bacterium]